MAVYVDNMRAKLGRMVMCHMMADTREELDAMADKIGVQRKWIQCVGTEREHYDVALAARAKAVLAGAQEVTMMDIGRLMQKRRAALSATPQADREG